MTVGMLWWNLVNTLNLVVIQFVIAVFVSGRTLWGPGNPVAPIYWGVNRSVRSGPGNITAYAAAAAAVWLQVKYQYHVLSLNGCVTCWQLK